MNKKDKIIEVLMASLNGCDRATIYCNTCIGNTEEDDIKDRCDGCIRKSMYWGISKDYAEQIGYEILRELENNND